MYSDAENLLSEHPTVETVEALITDCNGAARGKWLPIEKLPALMTEGIKLPKSAVAQDIWGRDVPRIALENGDIDGWCQVVPRLTGASAGQPRRRQSTSYPEYGQG